MTTRTTTVTEQHYIKCRACTLEGVSHWGVGEAGSCAVCQGVGFVAVESGKVIMSDRIHGIVWSELRRLMVEPDGSNEAMARADAQAVGATDRLLAALTEAGYRIVPDAIGDVVEIGELAPRIALKDVEDVDATGEAMAEIERRGWHWTVTLHLNGGAMALGSPTPNEALCQLLAAVSGEADNDTSTDA